MMVIAVGLSSYNIALFHLVNHAFYKGLLFLGAGAVIHAVADNQDFRKYGGLRPFLPLTYSVMLIASLSLVAFPFMTGFYSKDFILESAYGQFYFSGTVVYFIATIGAMFTTLYSVKVLYLTFLTNPNGPVLNYKHAHEGDMFMSLPLIILAVFSIFFGYITKDIFIGLGSGFFSDNSIFIHPTHEIMLDTEFAVPTFFKLLPLVFTISLSVLAIVLSEFLGKILINFKFSRLGYNIFGFFNQRFLIELFYNKYITGLVFKLGGFMTKIIDKGAVELGGPFGLEKGLINLSRNIASLDTGVITSYALYILIGLIFYILIPYLSLFDNDLLLVILLLLVSLLEVNNNTNNTNNTRVLESNILGSLSNTVFFKYKIVARYYSSKPNYLNTVLNDPSLEGDNPSEDDNSNSKAEEDNPSEGNENSNSKAEGDNPSEGNENSNSEGDDNSSEGDGNSNPSEGDNDSAFEEGPDHDYYDDYGDAVLNTPAKDVPETVIVDYIKQTGDIAKYPENGGAEANDSVHVSNINRNAELREELRRRKRDGEVPNAPSPSPAPSDGMSEPDNTQALVKTDKNMPSGINSTNDQTNASSSGKRKYDSEDQSDAEGSPILTKKIKLEANNEGTAGESSSKRKYESDDESSSQPLKKFKQDSSDITSDTEPFDFGGGDD
jgi:NADH-ubiquinone oxidoreductase chain 5